jgi:hypothetical protein
MSLVRTFVPGRLPNDASRPRIRLRVTTGASAQSFVPPVTCNWYAAVDPDTWGMDGNDSVRDCTIAEVDHTIKATEVAAGNPEVSSATGEVLAGYSAVTGYDPEDPSTDRGAEMQQVRAYWRKPGFTLGGTDHTIALFAEIDGADVGLARWACAHFGPVGLGINCPQSALEQYDAGEDWTVVPGSPDAGGHAISLVGYDAQWLYVVTWGRLVRMSYQFWSAYVEEAWTQLDAEFINATSGNDPLGEVVRDLGAQFEALTGQPNPFPAPTPEPTPAPGPVPPGGGDLPFLDTDPELARHVDRLVRRGRYPDRASAVMHALRMYFREH